MDNCLFCKIIAGDIPANLIYEDEHVVAFDDINPQAPTHKLIIPRKHIATLNDVNLEESQIVGHMAYVGQQLANELDHGEQGYRLVMNCNEHGGQTVFHIHMHLLAGRQLDWPPG